MKLIRWVLLWALATTAAGIVSVILIILFGAAAGHDGTLSTAAASGMIWGLVVGTGQWLVLRQRLTRSMAWIPLTVLGGVFAACFGQLGERSALLMVSSGLVLGACQSVLLVYYFESRGAVWVLVQGVSRLAVLGTVVVFKPVLPGILAALLAVAVSGLTEAVGMIAVFIGGPPKR